MPLEHSKSPEAFSQNVSTEVKAGKPIKQALAIAYSEKRHSDMLPTTQYKSTLQGYGLSSLKNNNGAVTSPQEARQIAAQKSGQSENFDPRNFNVTTKDKIMSTTVIPQSSKQHHPGANQKYVNSRGGEKAEAPMTKNASIKHENPEFFKRQTDRKHADSMQKIKDVSSNNAYETTNKGRGIGFDKAMPFNHNRARHERDGGPGSGPQEGLSEKQISERNRSEIQQAHNSQFESQKHAYKTMSNVEFSKAYGFSKNRFKERNSNRSLDGVGKKDNNIPARKDVPIQRDMNHRQPNVGNDPGRGVGCVGKDAKNIIAPTRAQLGNSQFASKQKTPTIAPTKQQLGTAQFAKKDSTLQRPRHTDQNGMKQFARGTMY